MNSSASEQLAAARQALFGGGDFLGFTLRHPLDSGPGREYILADGTAVQLWQTGILYICPAHSRLSGASLLISSGIHGNETAPMEICNTLVNDILSGDLGVNGRLLFVIGNPPAVNLQKRFCDENLNRLFEGKHRRAAPGDSSEGLRAQQIEYFTGRFFSPAGEVRLHYDLHTAIRASRYEKFAVYPYLHGRPHSLQQLRFLQSCDIEAVLLSNRPGTTYSYYTSRTFDAHSFTVELGKVQAFGDNDMGDFRGIIAGLKNVIAAGPVAGDPKQPLVLKVFKVVEEVIKKTDRFRLTFAEDVPNFTEFPPGTVLATDTDFSYTVKAPGECIVFPNAHVQNGHRAVLMVSPADIAQPG